MTSSKPCQQLPPTPPKKIPEGIKNVEYYKLLAVFHQDLKEEKADYIAAAFDRLVTPYVNANKYVFENYLAYTLVSSEFLKNTTDFAAAFAGFAGEFVLMLIYAAGLFHANESLTHDEMIIAMYLFHRKVSHNSELRKRLAGVFSNNAIAMLIGTLGGVN